MLCLPRSVRGLRCGLISNTVGVNRVTVVLRITLSGNHGNHSRTLHHLISMRSTTSQLPTALPGLVYPKTSYRSEWFLAPAANHVWFITRCPMGSFRVLHTSVHHHCPWTCIKIHISPVIICFCTCSELSVCHSGVLTHCSMVPVYPGGHQPIPGLSSRLSW